MSLLVDTSVWSLAFRRDRAPTVPEVNALRGALAGGDTVLTTGLILQELLQGFAGPRVLIRARMEPFHSRPNGARRFAAE